MQFPLNKDKDMLNAANEDKKYTAVFRAKF